MFARKLNWVVAVALSFVLGQGAAHAAVVTDTDGDGIDDAIEDAVPSDGTTMIGDGNNDSIPDKDQPNVMSLPLVKTGEYVTVNTTCDRFLNGATYTEPQIGLDVKYDYPFGLIEFATCNGNPCNSDPMAGSVCSSATIGLKFFGTNPFAAGSYVYRKYGPLTPGDWDNLGFYDFTANSFFGGTLTDVGAVSLYLTDGSLGDDSYADGIIVDQGGPSGNAPGAPAPAMSLWALAAGLVGMSAVAAFALRRSARG